jgi:hypothetical protein
MTLNAYLPFPWWLKSAFNVLQSSFAAASVLDEGSYPTGRRSRLLLRQLSFFYAGKKKNATILFTMPGAGLPDFSWYSIPKR